MIAQFNVPNQVIQKFMERGKNLAFLAGHKDGVNITVSHIILPIQREFLLDKEYGKYPFKFMFTLFIISSFAVLLKMKDQNTKNL